MWESRVVSQASYHKLKGGMGRWECTIDRHLEQKKKKMMTRGELRCKQMYYL